MININGRIRELIQERKDLRRDRLEQRRQEIFSRFPRVKEIEARLDSTGFSMMSRVIDGSETPDSAVEKIMAENRAFVRERTAVLTSAGYAADYLDDNPVCSVCGDTGYIDGRPCSCVMNELDGELAADANLSEKLAGQTFAGFRLDCYSPVPDPALGISPRDNMRSVLEICRKFADGFDSPGESLFFTGGCGLGKTYLSSAIAHELLRRGVDVLYVSANSLFSVLEDIHFNRNVSEKSRYIADHALDARLLILDDLGSEFVTPFTSSELFRIVNNRLLDGKKTVISTNLSIDETEKRYSARLHSRIVGGYTIIKFFGEDLRWKLKNELPSGKDN